MSWSGKGGGARTKKDGEEERGKANVRHSEGLQKPDNWTDWGNLLTKKRPYRKIRVPEGGIERTSTGRCSQGGMRPHEGEMTRTSRRDRILREREMAAFAIQKGHKS